MPLRTSVSRDEQKSRKPASHLVLQTRPSLSKNYKTPIGKDTAASGDFITYSMIQHAGAGGKKALLDLINNSYDQS